MALPSPPTYKQVSCHGPRAQLPTGELLCLVLDGRTVHSASNPSLPYYELSAAPREDTSLALAVRKVRYRLSRNNGEGTLKVRLSDLHFKALSKRTGRGRNNKQVRWKDEGGHIIAVEEISMGMPGLRLAQVLSDKDLDLVVTCWTARLWKEAQRALKGSSTWTRRPTESNIEVYTSGPSPPYSAAPEWRSLPKRDQNLGKPGSLKTRSPPAITSRWTIPSAWKVVWKDFLPLLLQSQQAPSHQSIPSGAPSQPVSLRSHVPTSESPSEINSEHLGTPPEAGQAGLRLLQGTQDSMLRDTPLYWM
ncbi:hypothetical protein NM208_g16159 [Fusarium decemcellulare]|uniref:Uncharacterized protein n=1 Tax=Fusarium decemcellulare TaxID=57161 RepID=A0ACC1RAY5_9HYPO|nr:hypothetical protein NM208_g16159 [Fusarium decemcellulare]